MIALRDVTVRSGSFRMERVAFEIPAAGYGVLMGKTGSGKTTILEAICGLRRVESGTIVCGGKDVTDLPPAGRGVGYVPQDRALFRTATVREHLAFGPSLRGWKAEEIEIRVIELSGLLGLDRLLDRRPAGLSGGEAQRVALGRALASRPNILILDEPLSALDDETWDEMVDLLRTVRERTRVTTLHVTHRREEARRLADMIYVVRDGRVQAASAADLQELPK